VSLLLEVEEYDWLAFAKKVVPLTVRINKLMKIGAVARSKVWKVMLKDGLFSAARGPFAVKLVNMSNRDEKKLRREIALHCFLSNIACSDYFVKLIGWKMENNRLFIVMEYLDYDLFAWIDKCKQNPFDPHFKELILFDVANGIDVLHNLGLSHRDLKPQNILIKVESENKILVKICDFETTRPAVTGTKTENLASLWYMAPEQTFDQTIDTSKSMQKWDVWGFGLLIFFMFTGREPNPIYQTGSTEHPTIQYVKREMYQLIPSPWKAIMLSCLMADPKDRPTISEILNTLWTPQQM